MGQDGAMDAEARSLCQDVGRLLGSARAVLFVTGAGISVDSGLPTYRGVGGLYADADTDDGMPIEEALSGRMLRTRPEVAWKHLWVLGQALQGKAPNRGHHVLADIEAAKPDSWVLTQNVDGFHQAAGSRNLIEIHGRRDRLSCMACGAPMRLSEMIKAGRARPPDPPCCACGGVLRPGVVLFGEMLPEAELARLDRALRSGFDLVMSIGTSSGFSYIQAPMVWAREQGVPAVEINADDTPVSPIATHRIRAGATPALERIWAESTGS